jgi:hypothetical protein
VGAFQRHIVTAGDNQAVDATILSAFSYLDILLKEAPRHPFTANQSFSYQRRQDFHGFEFLRNPFLMRANAVELRRERGSP